jgi:serine/threonine protein kinase
MRIVPSIYESLRVNDQTLSVEAELHPAKPEQYLLLVRTEEGQRLLARCLRATDHNDLEAAQQATASVRREIDALRNKSLPELPRIYETFSGPASLLNGKRKIDVMVVIREFIEGVPVDERLRGIDAKVDQIRVIISWLECVLRGLNALHYDKVGHYDIRASNVIQPDAQGPPAVLIDLNSSQVLRFNSDARSTILYIDPRLAPSDWYRSLAGEGNGIDLAQLGADADLEWLDWYQFGLLIEELLAAATNLSLTNRRYLEEVAKYLTSYPSCKDVRAPEIRRLLERAKPEFLHPYGVPELVRNAPNSDVEIFPDGQVLTKVGIISDIIKHPAFTRLFDVKQLTLLRYVFVGAEHTRAMHMMHCASLAADLMQHMFSDARFRRTFESRDVRFAIVAALLHDINHFPFLHTFQESASSIFTNRALFDDVMTSDFHHFTGIRHEPLGDLLRSDGIDPESIWRVCYGERTAQRPDSPVEQFVNSMLESGVDLDKLSYLVLDALHTGVPIGTGIDHARLMRSALMTPDPFGMECLAFDTKAMAAAESVVHARLANFRSIYWHPRNRALMTMFLHVADSINLDDADGPDLRREFLVSSEADVVIRMNALYQERVGRPSPMAHLIPLRGAGLYEELYQVPAVGDWKHETVSRILTGLSGSKSRSKDLVQLRRAVGAELIRRYPGIGKVHETDVLIDIPSRPTDGRIRTLLRDDRGAVEPISELSSAAHAAVVDFQRLAKSVRIFVAPKIAEKVSASSGSAVASWLGDMLFEQVNLMRNGGEQLT